MQKLKRQPRTNNSVKNDLGKNLYIIYKLNIKCTLKIRSYVENFYVLNYVVIFIQFSIKNVSSNLIENYTYTICFHEKANIRYFKVVPGK